MTTKYLLVTLLFLLGSNAISAQEDARLNEGTSAVGATSLQLQLGTQGIGLGLRYDFTPKVGLKLGGNFIAAKTTRDLDFNDFRVNLGAQGQYNNLSLTGDYALIPAFRIVVGAAYQLNTYLKADVTPTEQVEANGIVLEADEIGDLHVDVSYTGVAPYLGLGIGRATPKNRFNVSADLGTYYLNSPNVIVVGTEYLAGNDINGPKLEQNLKGYRWMPVLQVNLTFRLF